MQFSLEKVYTIQRKQSNCIFSIRSHCDHGRPAVIAFKSKEKAYQFVACERAFDNKASLCLNHLNLDILKRRCNMNALVLTVFDDDGEFEKYDYSAGYNDLQFHYENVLRYL